MNAAFALVLLAAPDSSGRREPLDPARCGYVRSFETADEAVFAVSASPKAGFAAAGRRDGKVRIWDLRSGRVVRDLEAHSGYCYAALFSPDGRRLATAGLDGAVKLWNPETWTLERTLREKGGAVFCLAFASGGRRVVAGGPEGAWAWTPGEGGPATLGSHASGVTALAAQGDRALTAGADGSLRLWDLAAAKELRTFEGPKSGLAAAAFHPDGRSFATAGADGVVRLWEPASPKPVRALEAQGGPIRAIAYTSGGRFLAAAGAGGVRFWDVVFGRPAGAVDPGASACGAAFAADGRELLVTGTDNRVSVWGVPSGAVPPEPAKRPGGFLGVSYVDGGGAYVRSVLGGTEAERVGFQADDVITGVDDLPIEKSDDFLNYMRRALEGEEIDVRVRRGDATRVVRVKLGRWEEK
jgi:WD40 repeat protein